MSYFHIYLSQTEFVKVKCKIKALENGKRIGISEYKNVALLSFHKDFLSVVTEMCNSINTEKKLQFGKSGIAFLEEDAALSNNAKTRLAA